MSLRLQVFQHRLDDGVDIDKRCEVRGRLDAGHGNICLGLRQPSALDAPLNTAPDPVYRALKDVVRDVPEEHLEALLCSDLHDATTHGATARHPEPGHILLLCVPALVERSLR